MRMNNLSIMGMMALMITSTKIKSLYINLKNKKNVQTTEVL